jgi:hypothetical protein
VAKRGRIPSAPVVDCDLMLPYLALAGVVFGVNLLPAFGPPTRSVLVFFRVQSHIPAVPLVLLEH